MLFGIKLNDEGKRILLKTVCWGAIAASTSMLLLYFSGQLALALGVGVFEVLTRTVLHFSFL